MTDRDKLIELLGNLSISCEEKIGCINCKYNKETCCKLKRKADYLLENGVIVPPCKVGDTVYFIENQTIKKGTVRNFGYESHLWTVVDVSKANCVVLNENLIYLTKESAEQALKERDNNAET